MKKITNRRSLILLLLLAVLLTATALVGVSFGLGGNNVAYAQSGGYFTNANYTTIEAPIFNANGTVNKDSVREVKSILAAVQAKVGVKSNYSAEDFGKYANGAMGDTDQQGIILVRLFPQNTEFTTASTLNTADELKAAANEYWQLVYTTDADGQLICTLYMENPYTTSAFIDAPKTGGYYSKSYIRDKVIDLYTQLSAKFTMFEKAAVGAQSWQMTAYQTSMDNVHDFSPPYYDANVYVGPNGMDENSACGTPDITSDKMWLPSNFEVIYEGKGTGNAGGLTDEYPHGYAESNDSNAVLTNTNRSGLWRMNGYDRGFDSSSNVSYSWLRPSPTSGPNNATMVNANGSADVSTGNAGVNNVYGVRPALHLNVDVLDPAVFSTTYDETNQEYTITGFTTAYLNTLSTEEKGNIKIEIPAVYNDGKNGEHKVTAIGASAFQKSKYSGYKFTSLDLTGAATLKIIGESAFRDCTIDGLTIPKSVVEIGNYAFNSCGIIDSPFTFENGSSLRTIGDYAFGYVKFGGILEIPASVQTIGEFAFVSSHFSKLTFKPNSKLETISENAFSDAYFTGDLILPDSLKILGDAAFNYGGFDGKLVLPNNSSFTAIPTAAFAFCGFKGVVTIPSYITDIGMWAFAMCDGITQFNLLADVVTVDWTYEVIPGDPDASDTSDIIASPFPVGSLIVMSKASYETAQAQQIDYTPKIAYETSVKFYLNDTASSYTEQTKLFNQAFGYEKDANTGVWSVNTAYTLPVPDSIPSGHKAVGFYDVATGGKAIKNDATSLQSTVVAKDAYYYRTEAIPQFTATLTNGECTIMGFSDDYLNSLSEADKANISIVIPAEYEIGSVKYPVTEIGSQAFYSKRPKYNGCTFMSLDLSGATNLKTIGVRAFWECSDFDCELVLPEGLQTIGTNAFEGCAKFTGSLKIPNSVTTIGGSAFYGCSKISQIEIPNMGLTAAISYGDFPFVPIILADKTAYETATAEDGVLVNCKNYATYKVTVKFYLNSDNTAYKEQQKLYNQYLDYTKDAEGIWKRDTSYVLPTTTVPAKFTSFGVFDSTVNDAKAVTKYTLVTQSAYYQIAQPVYQRIEAKLKDGATVTYNDTLESIYKKLIVTGYYSDTDSEVIENYTAAFTDDAARTAFLTGTNNLTLTYTYKEGSKTCAIDIDAAKIKLNLPTVSGTYTYTGSEQTIAIDGLDSNMAVVSGNKGTDAGNYTLVIKLNDTDNYAWVGGSSADLEIPWSIGRLGVTKPVIQDSTYTGVKLTANVVTTDAYTVTGNEQKNANEDGYTVTVTLKKNYKWSDDDSTDSLTLKWIIHKATVSVTPIYDANAKVYVGGTLPTISSDQTALGTIAWNTHTLTESATGKSFDWTWTPNDANNYNTATGTVTFDVIAVELEKITATFTQGENKVYTSNTLDSLKSMLVVKGTNNDGSDYNDGAAITDYTLLGTLEAGEATVTVKYGDKEDTFKVNVTAVVLESISAEFTQGNITVFTSTNIDDLKTLLGDALIVTNHYNNGTTTAATDFTLSGSLATAGNASITVTSGGKSTIVTVKVTAVALAEIKVEYTQGDKVIYTSAKLDDLKTDLSVSGTNNDGTAYVGTIDYVLSGTLAAGTSTITVTVKDTEISDDFTVTVTAVALKSITATFTQGENKVYTSNTLDSLKSMLVVKGTNNDGSDAGTIDNYTLSGTLAAGEATVTVKYGDKEDTFKVTVTAVVLESISAEFTQGNITVFTSTNIDDLKTLLGSALVVTNHYNDGTTAAATDFTLSGSLATAGNALITVSSGGKETTVKVNVTAVAIAEITAVYTQGNKTIYASAKLDDLKTDLSVTGKNNDGSDAGTIDYVLSGTLAAGTSTITVTVKDTEISDDFTVTVTAVALKSITATFTQGENKVYTSNTLDSLKSMLVVKGTNNDGSDAGTIDNYTLTGTLLVGDTNTITVTVTGTEITATFNVVVTATVLEDIEVTTQPTKTAYKAFEDFDAAGMVVTATFNHGEEVITDYTIVKGSNLTAGTASITISYTFGGVTETTTVAITVAKIDIDMSGISFNDATLKEDGDSHTITLMGTLPEGVSVEYTGGNQTAPGIYTVTATFTLADPVNYNAIEPRTATLTINKAVVVKEENVGEDKKETVVIESEQGLAPDIVLDASDVTSTDHGVVVVEKNTEVKQVYDVKLIQNGTAVQPNGSITIRLLIAETLRGEENLKVLHISADGTETDVNAVRDGDYMVFTVSSLSKFAIIGDAPDIVSAGAIAATVIFWLLALIGAAYIVYYYKKHNGNNGGNGKKSVKTYSFAPLLLSAVVVPAGLMAALVIGIIAFVGVAGYIVYLHIKDGSLPALMNRVLKRPQPIAASTAEAVATNPVETFPLFGSTETEAENKEESVETAAEPIEAEESEHDEKETLFRFGGVVYHRSFLAKLIQGSETNKRYYDAVKNEFLSYKKVRSSISFSGDTFTIGRKRLAVVNIAGKTLKIYLALDPETVEKKYAAKDVADKKKYARTPCCVRIKSDTAARKIMYLISRLMKEAGAEYLSDTERKDYVSMYPYEETEALIARGLIKKTVVGNDETVKADISTLIRGKITVSEAQSAISDEVAAALVETYEENNVHGSVAVRSVKKGVVNIDALSENFSANETVTLDALKEKGLIARNVGFVKVLARGTLDKPLTVKAQDFSLDAVRMIALTGGKAIKTV